MIETDVFLAKGEEGDNYVSIKTLLDGRRRDHPMGRWLKQNLTLLAPNLIRHDGDSPSPRELATGCVAL